MGFHCRRNGGTFQRDWTPSIQGHQCFESWNSEKEKVADEPCTSMRIHRTQNSCFAQFTQQISSVSTEQYQAGVKSSLNGLRIKKSRLRKSSQKKKASRYWKMWSRKKWFFLCNPQGATIGNLDTDGENALQSFQTLEKEIQFTRVCEDAASARRVSIAT